MKKVLILILSIEREHYKKLLQTSLETWDLLDCEGVETVFYCGESSKPSSRKILYTPVKEDFFNMGYKHLEAFDHALKKREFDFIFSVGASMYVHKPGLLEYVQDKPTENLALGLVTNTEFGGEKFNYMWGGGGYLLSKDVVQKIVDNRMLWNHKMMEDQAVSYLLNQLDVIMNNEGYSASISIQYNHYSFITYADGMNGGCMISDLKMIKDTKQLKGQFAFRVKDDANRANDLRLMNELFKALNDV